MGPKILIFSHRSEGAVTSLKVKPRIPGKISPALKFEKSTFRSRYCILNLYKNTLFDVSSMRIILTNPSTFDFIISFLFFSHCFIFHFINSQILSLNYLSSQYSISHYFIDSTFHPTPFNLSSLDIPLSLFSPIQLEEGASFPESLFPKQRFRFLLAEEEKGISRRGHGANKAASLFEVSSRGSLALERLLASFGALVNPDANK